MGFDGKYGKITQEYGNIPDDEPVLILRARDLVAPQVIDHYARLAEGNGSPAGHVALVREARDRFIQWQTDHPDRAPVVASSATYFERIDSGEQRALPKPEPTTPAVADIPGEHWGERNDEES